MKIALYIEDGAEQIVLTPQSKTEKTILEKMADRGRSVEIKRGEFYSCMGGWTRQGAGDSSTIIIIREDDEPAGKDAQ